MRFSWLFAVFALTFAISAHAQQKPNSFTRDEIEKGWLLLFDGETTWGWAPMHTAPNAKIWTVANGPLEPPEGPVHWHVNTTAFGDFEMTGECHAENRAGAILALAESTQTPGTPTTYTNRQVFSSNIPAEEKWSGFCLRWNGSKATLRWAGGKPESYGSIRGLPAKACAKSPESPPFRATTTDLSFRNMRVSEMK